jgi:hypothetical protein
MSLEGHAGESGSREERLQSEAVATRGPYEQGLQELEARSRPTTRNVLRYLFKSDRRGLVEAAREADAHAEALEALHPPEEARAAHVEYVVALRAIGSEARELAERGDLRGRRALLRQLKRLPSFQRMVDARRTLLGERQPRR